MNADNNALIPVDDLGVVKHDDTVFDKIASSDFMPRIQLMTSNSKQCKSGDFPINHYAIVRGKNLTDLTAEVNLLVIAWRPKAVRMGEAVMAFFNVENPEFAKIEEDSKGNDSGCMYGPEFLVYSPTEQEYATFFMGSKSSRNESPSMKQLIGKAATLKAQELSNAKYSWYACLVTPCSTPFEIPEMEEIREQVTKFNSAKDSEIETADEPAGEERAR